jgi:putative oxidoreductase
MQSMEKLKPLALLLLRWGLGVIFVYHGYPKLFTHTQQAMQGFVHMGFPSYFVYIAGAIEFFGGCLLLVGLFTRIAGLLLAGEMAVALWKVHVPQGGVMAVQNYEFPLALAVGAFALAALGAGLLSLDYALFREGRSTPRRASYKD